MKSIAMLLLCLIVTIAVFAKKPDLLSKLSCKPNSNLIVLYTDPITVSGMVWNDADGNVLYYLGGIEEVINGTNNGSGVLTGAILFANMTNAANIVIASSPVNENGTYRFTNVPQNNSGLSIQVSKSQGVPGMPKPAAQLPAGWVNTGENKNGHGGLPDVTADGEIAITTGTVNLISMDFGIERPPVALAQIYFIMLPVSGSTLLLNGNGTLSSPAPLAGDDVEDGPLGTGNTFIISDVSGLSGNKLFYNGTLITAATTITHYNPLLLQVQFNSLPPGKLSFKYTVLDAANKSSALVSYTIRWGIVLPLQTIQLTATLNNTTTAIEWKTADEINTAHFYVQRSTDNSTFSTLEKLAAAGTTAGTTLYHTQNNISGLLAYPAIYYRIKMSSTDGRITYSNVTAVKPHMNTIYIKLICNSCGNTISIQLNAAISSSFIFSFFDASGRRAYTQQLFIDKGRNRVTLTLPNYLSGGIYTLQLHDQKGTLQYVQQFFKN